MGIEVYRGSLDAQATSTGTMVKQQLKAYESLEKSLSQIENSASVLSGQAYDSFRSFVSSVVMPLKEAGVALAEATQESVKKLPSSYRSEVADEDLQEEKLISDIERYDQIMSAIQRELNEIGDSQSTSPGDFQRIQRLQRIQGLNVLDSIFQSARNELQEKLNKLRAFNTSSPEIFGDIDVLSNAIQTGISQINLAWDPNTRTYTVPTDLSWITDVKENVENRAFAKKHKLERPQNVTWKEYNEYITGLRDQTNQLKEVDGWDQAAINSYVQQVKKGTSDINTGSGLVAKRDELFAQTKEIGSDVYTIMYADSKLDSKAKVELVLKQLGAETDENQFMHLTSNTHKISENLPPHGDFNMYFRRDVAKAFGNDNLNPKERDEYSDEELALRQQVHFFRYYLDRQAIYYIRSHYEGATDYEKLLAYGKENNIEFDYSTGSNYHNRFKESDGFQRPYNMKVQVPQGNSAKGKDLNNARMVEFIVNMDTGEFDSQWDAYDKHKLPNGRYNSDPSVYSEDELREIANTESFNYGPSTGQNSDVTEFYKGKHGKLDMYRTPEPATRDKAKDLFESELDLGEVDKDTGHKGQFADIVRKGHEDYEAWQRNTKGMSEEEKVEEYNKFKKSLNDSAANNTGYYDYTQSQFYPKDHQ